MRLPRTIERPRRVQHNSTMNRAPFIACVVAILVAVTAAWSPANRAQDRAVAASATRAEVQIGLCAPPHEIERALALRPRGPMIVVWLFDDPTLTLFGHGLRFRLRVAEGRSELTLKVADQECAKLPVKLMPAGEGKCEYDMHGTQLAGAMSLSTKIKSASDLLSGRLPLARALSAAQIKYLRKVVRFWPLPPDIRALGPIEVRTYRGTGNAYDVDVSQLPGGERFVEISTKVPVADAARAKSVLESDLSRAGIAVCADQSAQAVTKLRSLLK